MQGIEPTRPAGTYRLRRVQQLPISLEKAWEFFSSPKNLREITPDYLGFRILSGADQPMHAGQKIRYKVSPVLRIPLTWVTEISNVKEGSSFTDKQLKGPYALWRHHHIFRPAEGGVEMEDIVDYKLPLGILGRMAHRLFVKRQVEGIFAYRSKKLDEIFGDNGDIR